jgi:hypothetical protein
MPRKRAALLALVYSQLVPLGVLALTAWVPLAPTPERRELAEGAIAAIGLALRCIMITACHWGMHRHIPTGYPSGWYAADRVRAADDGGGRAVFLPRWRKEG